MINSYTPVYTLDMNKMWSVAVDNQIKPKYTFVPHIYICTSAKLHWLNVLVQLVGMKCTESMDHKYTVK